MFAYIVHLIAAINCHLSVFSFMVPFMFQGLLNISLPPTDIRYIFCAFNLNFKWNKFLGKLTYKINFIDKEKLEKHTHKGEKSLFWINHWMLWIKPYNRLIKVRYIGVWKFPRGELWSFPSMVWKKLKENWTFRSLLAS